MRETERDNKVEDDLATSNKSSHLDNHSSQVHDHFIFVVGVDKLLEKQVPVVDHFLIENL